MGKREVQSTHLGTKDRPPLGRALVPLSKETLQRSLEASGFLSCSAFLCLGLDKTSESSYLHLNAAGKR